ncbi:uncharacterized protein LOC115876206 [Sitophilus oryzae]|uniref:Uncharacterized protein LOC115876206 n=1 Tax=Sitophilus oryzae TaxID=7048 RepID=A0A6J2X9Y5_SITOR|nr:uncharacterized protein LOC115876206 [Sitophilus oryzae]
MFNLSPQILKMMKFIVIASVLVHQTYAKSGCSNYGHSCFGGMGKRSELANENYETVQENNVQEVEKAPVGFIGSRIPLSSEYPKRFYKFNKLTSEQYDEMNKILKEMMANNIRREEEIEN